MANQYAVTIPLENIEKIQIYINNPRKTVAAIKESTGADYILNGTLYNMKTGEVNCHLKVDGNVIKKPSYTVHGYAWDSGSDIALTVLPVTAKKNYIACTPLIKDRKKTSLIYDDGQDGERGRSAIGIKGDKLALYCSKDGTSVAKTPEQLQTELFSYGWDSAIMLDGGGSSQCDFAGQKITSTRNVQHLILVYLRKSGCPYKEPTVLIRSGSRGEGAKWVQWYLNKHGASLVVDGIFGTKSLIALREFQKNNGLTVDGICGALTRKALIQELNK